MEEHFQHWIGRSVTRSDVVSPRLVAEYRATLSPFLFESGDGACPPGLHLALAPATPATEDTGYDGAERKGLFLPPIPLPRRMWAGGVIESIAPLKQGVPVFRTSTIADIRFKQGSAGPLCLASILHEISDEQGPCIRERQDLVFREAGAPAAPAGEAREIDAQWRVDASPLLLFRFSAITFNGHRIHYDQAYAAEEGYSGLLVHGPLQAALMLNLASVELGHVPPRFEYRCLAPLYGGAEFGVNFDDGVARVIRADGVTTAEGRVHARGTG